MSQSENLEELQKSLIFQIMRTSQLKKKAIRKIFTKLR